MATTRTIIPDYLSVDFNTFKNRQIEILKKTDTFRDYNFEGPNITLLMEWFAYLSELSTFYSNKIAKNLYDDSAEIYENVNRLARAKGYNPIGYIASKCDLQITISQTTEGIWYPGDQLFIPAYKSVFAENTETGETIEFITTKASTITIPTSGFTKETLGVSYSFSVPVRQGKVIDLSYKGSDIIDNQLVLPFYTFDHEFVSVDDDEEPIRLTVNDDIWERVEDFYENISGLKDVNTTDDVYMFNYDKYKRYIIDFASFRNIPKSTSKISLKLIITDGENGNVGSNMITILDEDKSKGLVLNTTKGNIEIPLKNITITNVNASTGGTNPQGISTLSEAGRGYLNAQLRCVTKNDYVSYLEGKPDILVANVWGEKEISNKGKLEEYNKVHISVIPTLWSTGTIETSAVDWSPIAGREACIDIPIKFSDDYKEAISKYLEPRKMLMTYEEFDIPELIYFVFDIGLKVKRTYVFADVASVLKDKLDYYFNPQNRSFGETISFMNIHNYIIDASNQSEINTWDLVKGIESLVFRDILISKEQISQEKINFYETLGITIKSGRNIYPPNMYNDYPMYTRLEFSDSTENKLKIIKLGPNQFPVLKLNLCKVEKEY